MYNRRVLAGEFTVVNKYLLRDLTERGLWIPEVRNQIIADQGSVQNVRQIPQELKDLYKTVWEIKQKYILNQVRVRLFCAGFFPFLFAYGCWVERKRKRESMKHRGG